MVETKIDPTDPARNLKYIGSAGVSEGLAISATSSYTPPTKTQTGAGIISVTQSVGADLVSGLNVSAEVSNTFILADTQTFLNALIK